MLSLENYDGKLLIVEKGKKQNLIRIIINY